MIAWVTGASSGLGLYIAQALRDRGHTVIGGARSFSACEQDGIHCLPLDVTKPDSISAFTEAALSIAPKVDLLVNAAGILMLGSCEQTSPEEYARVLDTDFLGMVRMNNAALPLMRNTGSGRIIMLSSINGLLGIPYQSAYTATKHAVEGYAECLSMETHRFGIQISLIEPGDHRGGGQKCRLHAAAMADTSPYAADYQSAIQTIAHDEANGSDPARLGQKVARMAERKHLPLRKRIASPDQHLAVWLHDILPPALNSLILRMYYLGKASKQQQ